MTVEEAEKIKTVVENKDHIAQLLNTVVKAMIEAFENLKIEDVNMFKLGYNKAIDDFTEQLKAEYKPCDEKDTEIYKKVCNRIDGIAEQLKECD